MTKPPISLQDLRRRIYAKAKAEPSWRFWGLYVHVCKEETLREAYEMAKKNDGAPGIDGVTFAAIEAGRSGRLSRAAPGRAGLAQVRSHAEPEEGDPEGRRQARSACSGIPSIRDRVVQGALQAHPGADLRGRLPTGVVRIPTGADGARSGGPGGRRRSRKARRASSISTCGPTSTT